MAGELLLATLRHVWATLAPLRVEMALMGGLAVAAWKHLRNTRDVDFLIGLKSTDEPELVQRLAAAGLKPLRQPPTLVVGESRIMQLSYEPPNSFMDIRVDLFFAESEYHQSALARRVPMVLPGIPEPVSILSCEDLILFKLVAGRIIDRADCAYLLRFNRPSIDLAYLRQWAARLGLEPELAEVWAEAFPGEAPPRD